MYTTPRKVKQESRLRRSLSLTNNNNAKGNGTEAIEDCATPSSTSPYYTISNRLGHHNSQLNEIVESPVSVSVRSTFQDPFASHTVNHEYLSTDASSAGTSRQSFSYTGSNGAITIPDVIDVNQPNGFSPDYLQSQSQIHHPYSNSYPPPYRNPPQTLGIGGVESGSGQPSTEILGGPISPQSVPDSPVDSFHTHSSKFPLTLDSETAKELQNQLAAFRQQKERSQQTSLTGTSTIKRSGSAFELERLIEAFNQEQHALVMSSLHQGLIPKERVGIDNPALDLGGPRSNYSGVRNDHLHNHSRDQTVPTSSNHAHLNSHPSTSSTGGKMANYSFSDSSASQSLSLSSSNTDSLDTVIYKGPNAAAPSVRDWQQQRTKDSLLQQPDFGPRGEPSSYRGDSQGIFDNRSYPMQQASSALYQPVQFNGPGGMLSGQTPSSVMVSNGYSMEYRHQQLQPQQSLSVQSVQQSQQQQLLHQHSQQNGSVVMRQTNGPSSGSGIQHQQPQFNPSSQNLMLPTKSPMMTHKSLIPGPSPSSNSSNQSVPSASSSKPNLNGNCGGGDTSSVSVEKPKDSTKTFPTKTYNHIKDMISSRFGNSSSGGGSSVQKGLNNSNVVNNNTSTNNAPNNNTSGNNNTNTSDGNFSGMNGQHSGNSYVESSMGISPVPSYGMNQHGQLHNHTMHDAYGVAAGPQYFNGQSTMSPQNSGNQTALNGSVNSYRSPPMNDRKNVNTSFRKAIHQSTLKSNLAEESLQLRPIMETNNSNSSGNRDLYRSTQYAHGEPRYGLGHEPPSPSMTPHHVERAQRALDRLCEPSGPTFTRTGSGPMTHQNGIARMVQQFSGGNNTAEESGRPMYHANGKIGAMSPSSPAASQLSAGELGAIPRNRFTVTSGPSSTTSTSSGGLSAPLSSAGLNTTMTGMITAESSLSSPSSYVHNNKQTLVHQAPTASLQNGNSSNNNNSGSKSNHPTAGNNNSSNNNDQAPPPLPTSQKPEVSGASGHSAVLSHHFLSSSGSSHHNTLGLPPVLPSVLVGEKRENGDGSSGTMETSSSGNLVESSSSQGATGASNASSSALALNKNKSEQLKKITADLHNLAISVAAEQHFQNNHHHLQFAPGSGNSGGGVGNNNQNSSSSECENKGSQRIGSGQSHTTSDSGVGTVMLTKSPLNSISDQENCHKVGESAQLLLGDDEHKLFGDHVMDSVSSGNDSEWVDIVEPEIRQILELEKKTKPGKNSRTPAETPAGSNSLTTSTPAHITQGHHSKMVHGNPMNSAQPGEQSLMGDITASPIPHHRVVSGCGSPVQSPKLPKKFDLSSYNKKAIQNRSQEVLQGPSTSNAVQNGGAPSGSKVNKSPRTTAKVHRSNSGAGQRYGRTSRGDKGSKNAVANRLIKDLGLKGIKLSRHAASQILYPQDDNGDVTSTTTGLDLESMLDGQTEQTSDDDDDMSTTIDTTDAHAIRRQLESLESMYTEVLKVLGAKRFSGNRYPTSDLRNAKRRPYGSMSSLPSSVSSRPFRERKLKLDDKKKVKDIKSINKRFQRLESHVVTLARSVAHLSSEMRTQHLMVQEIESIRNEMQQLRNQVLKSSMQNQSVAAAAAAAQNFARVASGRNGVGANFTATDWTSFRNALPSLTNPCRVRKLTKFFGDEPPLVRIFLKKLGYEKYASAFEQERIGIMELPYLTEERLNKMGIPMGPRLRILQEAQLCLKPGFHPNNDSHHAHQQTANYGAGNLSVYVV